MRKPAQAPNVPWPPVKGDITISGDRATGRKAKCARCRNNILEVEIWHYGAKTGTYAWEPSGRFTWIHYDPQPACRGASHE